MVYKGVLKDKRAVAVKKLSDINQGEEQFMHELSVIGRIYHMNLVRVWGFCYDDQHRIWVSEYIYAENGSLDEILFASQGSQALLEWKQRINIALRVAKGIPAAVEWTSALRPARVSSCPARRECDGPRDGGGAGGEENFYYIYYRCSLIKFDKIRSVGFKTINDSPSFKGNEVKCCRMSNLLFAIKFSQNYYRLQTRRSTKRDPVMGTRQLKQVKYAKEYRRTGEVMQLSGTKLVTVNINLYRWYHMIPVGIVGVSETMRRMEASAVGGRRWHMKTVERNSSVGAIVPKANSIIHHLHWRIGGDDASIVMHSSDDA
uniref:Serine-threonine/tyrosine-protein kinase catalytic domain-containing protein n=1 Tax=Oryza brachyantha TaxID=4533 RepID=J3MF87_ORYBR